MLIRIRRSKDLFLLFQSFECSNLFASNYCIYCGTTRCNKCGRIRTKLLFFFTFIVGCCVVIEKNIDKKLPNRISYKIWCKRCLTGKFGIGSKLRRGIKSANGPTPEQLFSPIVMAFTACTYVGPDPGPNPPTDMDWGGSKSAVTPAFQERNQGWNTRSHFNLYFHESSKHFKI